MFDAEVRKQCTLVARDAKPKVWILYYGILGRADVRVAYGINAGNFHSAVSFRSGIARFEGQTAFSLRENSFPRFRRCPKMSVQDGSCFGDSCEKVPHDNSPVRNKDRER